MAQSIVSYNNRIYGSRPANCYAFAVFVTLWQLIIRRYGFAANNMAESSGSLKKLLHKITQQMAPLMDA